MKILISLVGCLTLLCCSLATAQGDMIDFETGFSDGDIVTHITTPVNHVTFWTWVTNATPPYKGSTYVARVGDPMTAFKPIDTPVGGGGVYCLTDGYGAVTEYFMSFGTPVSNISLDLYDYNRHDSPAVGDKAFLVGYSDLDATVEVKTDEYAIKYADPDGNVIHLSIAGQTDAIRVARLYMEEPDGGTAVDNIEFTNAPVPVPTAVWLLGSGLLGLVGIRRKLTQ